MQENKVQAMNRKLPDIIGFTLEEARKRVHEAGCEIGDIHVTAPPRERSEVFNEDYRVVRATEATNRKVELLICKPL
jgi:hypothetical protein